ncbi:MAG: tripartite tricarboxylate transporter substrate-binding protein [Pseudomonadota bacterium]
MCKKSVLFFVALSLLLPALFVGHAGAKPFYEGKTITLIVTTKAGGGYDFYGRLIGKYMQKYLPGSTIIVKNMPGAGHIIGCNAIYHAKPNGLTFGVFNRALALAQVAELKGIKFDQGKMSWMGSPCSEVFSFIVSNKFKDLDAVKKTETMRLVSDGIGAINYLTPALFEYMAGLNNFKIATGYAGGEKELVIMRGEMDGLFVSWASFVKFVQGGHGHPILFIGKSKPKGYENIPFLQDVITDKKFQPIVKLLTAVQGLGRPFAGPPGIPEDRLKVLRDAFEKACNDPELIKIAEKAQKPIDLVSAAEAEEYTRNLLDVAPEVAKLIKKAHGVN